MATDYNYVILSNKIFRIVRIALPKIKMKRLLLIIVTFVLINQSFCQTNDTIFGKIVNVTNPCLDSPCLPGIVYAIENDTSTFIVSINKIWQWSDNFLIIDNDTLAQNDSVAVIGNINRCQDINLEKYYEIEVHSSYKFTTSIEQIPVNDIKIYPNPAKAMIQIHSNYLNINRIEIIDMFGRCVYNSSLTNCGEFVVNDFQGRGTYFLKITFGDKQISTKKVQFL